jgi:surface polysaccharide O-acyltransferase-like enzyme
MVTSEHPAAGPRILEYDFLRLVATIGVVLIHVTATTMGAAPGGVRHASAWILWPNLLARWSVPAFAFLTGALLWARKTTLTAGHVGSFFRRRIGVVAVPYLAWCAVYFLFSRLTGTGAASRLPAGLWPGVRATLSLLVQGKLWYHLYFIPVVLMLYLGAPFISPIARRWPALLTALAVVLCATRGLTVGRFVVNHPDALALLLGLLTYAPYAALGAWYAVDRERWHRFLRFSWPALLALGLGLRLAEVAGILRSSGTVGWLATTVAYMSLPILGMLGLGVAASSRLARFSRPLARASEGSFGVYLMHPLVITCSYWALLAASLPAWLWGTTPFAYACVAVVVAVAFSLSWLLLRYRATAWLV